MKTFTTASIVFAVLLYLGNAADKFQQKGISIGGSGFSPEAAALDRLPAEQAKARKAGATAASEALYDTKNKLASDGVDARVVGFLNQRIQDGSADAAFDLGVRYLKGQGVSANTNEAARLFKLAADRGNTEALKWISTNAPAGAAKSTNASTAVLPP